MWSPSLPAACAVLLALGCKGAGTAELPEGTVVVSDKAHLRTDVLGDPAAGQRSTFILVDADNRGSVDAYVTVDGEMAAADGRTWPLVGERLFIPAGATRTFVLLDEAKAERPEATGAQVRALRALPAPRPLAMVVSDLHVFTDGDKMVAAATVTNTIDKPGQAMVLAPFHDRDGRPMARQHTLVKLGGGKQLNVRFVGPVGSTKADIVVGEILY
ncbi:MAG: hypothetical protein KBG28_29900 [Kofleriaceae bacterium]|jgi:hypothetical protein|nr:hypothetical protein [Kofleriaceae bacterium]MBP6837969.1 hypothetical protein [Kofleriaceae bacterium]MBP9208220.1 hypothetical protein [Kofleriaceae bacterium]